MTDTLRRAAAKCTRLLRCGIDTGTAGENSAEVLPRGACTGKYIHQLRAITGIHCVAQGVEIGAKAVQSAQYSITIGHENVVPHGRIAACDAREVTKPACGIPEYVQVFVALGQRIDQAECQQMRQMTGGSQHLVVALDLHVLYIGPQG